MHMVLLETEVFKVLKEILEFKDYKVYKEI